jgi:hypothetical protein
MQVDSGLVSGGSRTASTCTPSPGASSGGPSSSSGAARVAARHTRPPLPRGAVARARTSAAATAASSIAVRPSTKIRIGRGGGIATNSARDRSSTASSGTGATTGTGKSAPLLVPVEPDAEGVGDAGDAGGGTPSLVDRSGRAVASCRA